MTAAPLPAGRGVDKTYEKVRARFMTLDSSLYELSPSGQSPPHTPSASAAVPPSRQETWAAFEAEAMPHMNILFRTAMCLTRDREIAEDLVQETFTKALQSFHLYTAGTNCRAWLITIMCRANSRRRRIAARFRFANDGEELLATLASASTPPLQGMTGEVLNALCRLPPAYQQAVILSDLEDLNYKEIAAALGIPIGTVMSRLHRGRKMLRAELSGYAKTQGIGCGDTSAQQVA